MTNYPANTTELLNQIETGWQELMAVVARLDPAAMTTPAADGWTPKDQLAHLAHWEDWLLRHHMAGEAAHEILQVDVQVLEEFDVDQMNALVLERNRQRSVDEVMAELQQTHAQVVKTLTELPFADLLRPRYADDAEARPLLGWVAGDTYEHYQEHREILERLLV